MRPTPDDPRASRTSPRSAPCPVDEAEDDDNDGGGVYPANGLAVGDRAEDEANDDDDEHENDGLARFEDSHLCHLRDGEISSVTCSAAATLAPEFRPNQPPG